MATVSDGHRGGERGQNIGGWQAPNRGGIVNKSGPKSEAVSRRPTILLSANLFWNIENFREGLINAFVAKGYRVVLAAPRANSAWAASRGAEAVEVELDRSGINPFRDACTIFNYHRLIRRTCPNFFLGFTPKPNIYGSFAASMNRLPALPNVSGLGTAFIKPGLLSSLVAVLYRIAFRQCPIVFFQNPEDRDLFVARKIVRIDQARLLPGSGIDLRRFTVRPSLSDQVRFLFIGRLLGDKGVREFVDAARILRSRHPEWRFQLLGPLDEDNRTAVKSMELADWVAEGVVEHLGAIDDVRDHIAASTAVVLPSYREGLPRSLLEAAAMARPLIATDVPGNRQIVRDGSNGLLCAVRDAGALAEAMERLATLSESDRNAMGLAGRALVEREYGEERVIQAYLDALAQLHKAGVS